MMNTLDKALIELEVAAIYFITDVSENQTEQAVFLNDILDMSNELRTAQE